MKQLNINLAESHEGPSSPCGCDSKDHTYYPSLHISGKKELDLPKEGVMTIRYKKTHSSVSESDKSEPHYSCNIEVREIVSAESDEVEAPSKRDRSAEESLDRLMDEKKKSYK